MEKKLLILSYVFPPTGGAGVQRVTKFVKYLPDYGWTPVVLTVQNPSVPVYDESLLDDVPNEICVIKARTFEPGYKTKQAVSASSSVDNSRHSYLGNIKALLRHFANFLFQPDPQILWFPRAKRKATQYIAQNKIDAIFATGPPFSTFLLGYSLSKKHGIPLVLDFRDEWDISNQVLENKKLGSITLAIQNRMQNNILKQASTVIATTRQSAQLLRGKIGKLDAKTATTFIYNGFDAKDFETINSNGQSKNAKYVLSYVGTLWNLTSIEPLILGILKLLKDKPELGGALEFIVAGRKTAEQDLLLDKLENLSINLIRHDYLDHKTATDLMLNSQGLCLLLSDIDSACRVVPAKIFEYMACRNSIFVIAPEGEAWELLSSYPQAFFAKPTDIASIAKFLADDIELFLAKGVRKVEGFDASRYERRTLTGQLASAIDNVIK